MRKYASAKAVEVLFGQLLASRGRADLLPKLPREAVQRVFKIENIATDGTVGRVTYCTATFRPINFTINPLDPYEKKAAADLFQAVEGDANATEAVGVSLMQISSFPPMRGQYTVQLLDNGQAFVEFAPGALRPSH